MHFNGQLLWPKAFFFKGLSLKHIAFNFNNIGRIKSLWEGPYSMGLLKIAGTFEKLY